MRLLRVGAAGLVLAAIGTSGALGYARLFGNFSFWDDEGYMLLALRAWREGGGLYDRISTIYGPFFFQVVVGVFSILRLPFDNVGARWFVLVVWEASSLLCALYVWRAHRSFLAAAAVWAVSFGILAMLTNEPLHPGGVVVVLLPAIALVSLGFGMAEPSRRTWAILGALTAALALTKVNLGVFVLFAVLGTWLRFGNAGRATPALRLVFALFLVAFPRLLMRDLMSKPWVREFALLASASYLPFAVFLFLEPGERSWRPRSLVAYAAGGVALTLVSLGICLATGSTLAGMWRCLVLDPMSFPLRTSFAPALPSITPVLASFAGVAAVFLLRRSHATAAAIACFTLEVAAAAFLLDQCTLLGHPLATLPCLSIFAVPGRDVGRTSHRTPLAFLSLLVALQAMHLYPVPGTQKALFLFLVPVLAVAGLWEAWKDLPAAVRARIPAWIARASALPAAAAGAWVLARYGNGWRALPAWWDAYHKREVVLGLPGAETLHLPETQALAYVWLAVNVRRHGDTFLSAPGLLSLYLWTGEKPPVPFYSHAWPSFLGVKEQRELGDAFFACENACVVRVPKLLEFWGGRGSMPDPELGRRIEERLQLAGETGGFELWTPRDREPRLVLCARAAEMPAEAPTAMKERVPLLLVLPAMEGVRLARFALVHGDPLAIVYDSSAAEESERMILVDEHGRELAGSIALDREVELLALLPRGGLRHLVTSSFVRCYDDRGSVVARLPVLDPAR